MSNAISAADQWLYSQLTANATLAGLVSARVYGHEVPPEATFPLVFFTLVAPAENVSTLNGVRIWSPLLYAVRYVDQVESYTDLEDGAAAIDSALNLATGSNVSGVIISSVYESPFALLEIDQSGYQVRHLGGLYRLSVQ